MTGQASIGPSVVRTGNYALKIRGYRLRRPPETVAMRCGRRTWTLVGCFSKHTLRARSVLTTQPATCPRRTALELKGRPLGLELVGAYRSEQ